MMIRARLVLVGGWVSQFRGNLDDRRENVGSEHNFSLKPDLAFPLKLFLPTNFTRSNIARLQRIQEIQNGAHRAQLSAVMLLSIIPHISILILIKRETIQTLNDVCATARPSSYLPRAFTEDTGALLYYIITPYHHHHQHQPQTVVYMSIYFILLNEIQCYWSIFMFNILIYSKGGGS